ncbi:diacylglycerol/lipid kinase family protein [Pseudohalioglobus lutimaris]|uniref:diacylglycerol/lipid kinase family protein n=1 Tax=Pseudohalioglobus lutimaris TaxID=1737061 RepID=UPI00096B715F|nr:diacylglycerol kinase family protein [Pseudohalioglobus lutimaris]
MKIALLIKGNLGHLQHIRRDVECLRQALPQAQITALESREAGSIVDLANRACEGSDYLIAVGGDGTLHEVLNGVLQHGLARRALPALGLLARGTANDYARTVGLRGDTAELIGLLKSGDCRYVDAGRIRYRGAGDQRDIRYFLNSADIGIGAAVVSSMQAMPLVIGRPLRYPISIARTFLTFRGKELTVRSDQGLCWRGRSLAVVAANGRYFGSGLCIAPHARIDDGQLSVTLVADASTADFLRHLGALRRSEFIRHHAVSYHRARRLEIEHHGDPAQIEADGEHLGTTPVTVDILPGAIKLLCPPTRKA